MSHLPDIYEDAKWRNTTPWDAGRGRIGVGFSLVAMPTPSQSATDVVLRFALDRQSASHLSDSLTEFLEIVEENRTLRRELNLDYAIVQSAIAMRHTYTKATIAGFDEALERRRGSLLLAPRPDRRPPLLGQWWLAGMFSVIAIATAILGSGWQALAAACVNALIVGVELGAIWQRYNERTNPQERDYLQEKSNA